MEAERIKLSTKLPGDLACASTWVAAEHQLRLLRVPGSIQGPAGSVCDFFHFCQSFTFHICAFLFIPFPFPFPFDLSLIMIKIVLLCIYQTMLSVVAHRGGGMATHLVCCAESQITSSPPVTAHWLEYRKVVYKSRGLCAFFNFWVRLLFKCGLYGKSWVSNTRKSVWQM